MTETTDNTGGILQGVRGVIFFDAACGVCRASAKQFCSLLERRGFRCLPLQSPQAMAMTGASAAELLTEVYLVTATRKVLRGVDALLYIAETIPWLAPLRWLARLPFARRPLDAGYRWFAKRRYRISSVCRLDGSASTGAMPAVDAAIRAVPPILLVLLSFAAGRFCAPWVWMWSIALAMFMACKWATWWPVRRRGTLRRNLAYFFAWTGMDAEAFCAGDAPAAPAARDWASAIGKTLCGASLIWIVARMLQPHAPTAAAWAGMIGVCVLLHFGLMQLIALAWRRAGVLAEPLMRQPARSTSLGEFWGRRWNTGFRFLAYDLVFRKLVRPLGISGATAAVFAVSGLIHDAVISIPAGGGYGRPTLYFLIQLLGVLLERTAWLKGNVRRGVVGWMYVAAFTLAPIGLLFPTPFIDRVIVPFLHVIGGLS